MNYWCTVQQVWCHHVCDFALIWTFSASVVLLCEGDVLGCMLLGAGLASMLTRGLCRISWGM